MMSNQRGFTMVEIMVSATLFVSMLGTVWLILNTGQGAYSMSEAFLQAQQNTRSAIRAMEQELSGDLITEYYIDPNNVSRVRYVIFRRLNNTTSPFVDATDTPAWNSIERFMYIWCPDGASTLPVPTVNWDVCGNLGFVPEPDQLLMVRQGAITDYPNEAPMWDEPRVIATGLQNPLTDVDDQPGFELDLYSVTGTVVPHAEGCVQTGYQGCRNFASTPWNFTYDQNVPIRLKLTFTIRTRAETINGRVVRSPDQRGSVVLENRQDMP